jgi:hypothetical protein
MDTSMYTNQELRSMRAELFTNIAKSRQEEYDWTIWLNVDTLNDIDAELRTRTLRLEKAQPQLG